MGFCIDKNDTFLCIFNKQVLKLTLGLWKLMVLGKGLLDPEIIIINKKEITHC